MTSPKLTCSEIELQCGIQQSRMVSSSPVFHQISIHFHHIPWGKLNFGVFTYDAWAVRPDGSYHDGYLLYVLEMYSISVTRAEATCCPFIRS